MSFLLSTVSQQLIVSVGQILLAKEAWRGIYLLVHTMPQWQLLSLSISMPAFPKE